MNYSARLDCAIGKIFVGGLLAISLAGCAKHGVSGVVPVTGKVTYKGAAVGGAMVSFFGSSGQQPATATTTADGTFQLRTLDTPGALPGSYVAVVQKTETPAELTKEVSMEDAAAQAGKPLPTPKELLPAKYASATSSPLKFEVKASGENSFNLELND